MNVDISPVGDTRHVHRKASVKSYRILFRIALDGEIEFQANSEEDAVGQFEALADADLIECVELGEGRRTIESVE